LERTPRGNFGYLGLYYDEQEIIPWIQGDYRFDKNDEPMDRFPSREIEIKALVEGQFIAKRAHAEHLGFNIGLYNVAFISTIMKIVINNNSI
jgi:xylulokinase